MYQGEIVVILNIQIIYLTINYPYIEHNDFN